MRDFVSRWFITAFAVYAYLCVRGRLIISIAPQRSSRELLQPHKRTSRHEPCRSTASLVLGQAIEYTNGNDSSHHHRTKAQGFQIGADAEETICGKYRWSRAIEMTKR